MKLRSMSTVLAAMVLASTLFACSGGDTGDGSGGDDDDESSENEGSGSKSSRKSGGSKGSSDDDDDGKGSSSSSETYSFCLGNSGWTCPTAAAKSDCLDGNCGKCDRDPSQCKSDEEETDEEQSGDEEDPFADGEAEDEDF